MFDGHWIPSVIDPITNCNALISFISITIAADTHMKSYKHIPNSKYNDIHTHVLTYVLTYVYVRTYILGIQNTVYIYIHTHIPFIH